MTQTHENEFNDFKEDVSATRMPEEEKSWEQKFKEQQLKLELVSQTLERTIMEIREQQQEMILNLQSTLVEINTILPTNF